MVGETLKLLNNKFVKFRTVLELEMRVSGRTSRNSGEEARKMLGMEGGREIE